MKSVCIKCNKEFEKTDSLPECDNCFSIILKHYLDRTSQQ
jgi:DNA-directed RNA polymerase subunit RPC12/RpoP